MDLTVVDTVGVSVMS